MADTNPMDNSLKTPENREVGLLNSDKHKSIFTFSVANFAFMTLFVLIVVQNICAIILSNFNYALANAVVALKDAYLYLILLTYAISVSWRLIRFRIKYCRAEELFIFLAIVYFTVGYIVSPSRNLLSYRQLMIIPLFYSFGSYFVPKIDLNRMRSALFTLMILVCLSGYVERFILFDSTETFWNLAGIGEYQKMKGSERWAFGVGGTPGSFYTVDFKGFGTIDHLRRMASLLFAEPTIFGQFLVMPIVYCFLARKHFWTLFFGIALLAVLSKGGLLAVVVAFAFYYIQAKRSYILNFFIVLGCISAIAATAYLAYFSKSFASVAVHLSGLAISITDLIKYPFGRGVGNAGNWAVLASYTTGVDTDSVGAGESYFGALIGQLGLVGVVFYFVLFYFVWRRSTAKDPFHIAIKYSILATLVSGIASESAISYVGTGYLFALMPFLYAKPLHEAK